MQSTQTGDDGGCSGSSMYIRGSTLDFALFVESKRANTPAKKTIERRILQRAVPVGSSRAIQRRARRVGLRITPSPWWW